MSEDNKNKKLNQDPAYRLTYNYFKNEIKSFEIYTEIENNVDIDVIKKKIIIIKNSSNRNFLLGYLYFKKHIWKEAIKNFNKIKNSDKNAIIYNFISNAFFNLGDLTNSLENAIKAYQLDSENISYLNNLGYIYLKLKDEQNAVFYYKKALSIDPNYLKANINLYEYFFYNKQPKKAIYYINKAVEIDSEHEERHIPFLITALQTYDLNEAFSVAEQFYKKYQNNPQIVAMLGALYKQKKEYNLAIQYLVNAINILKNDLNSSFKEQLCNIYEDLIDIFVIEENIDEIVKYSIEAIKYANIRNERLFHIYTINNNNIAINIIEKLLNNLNDKKFFTEKIGFLYFNKEQYLCAEKYFLKAINLKTQNIEIYLKYIAIIFDKNSVNKEVIEEYSIKEIIQQGLQLGNYDKDFITLSKSIAMYLRDKKLYNLIKNIQNCNK